MIRILESIENKEGKLVVNVKDSEGELKELLKYIKDVSDAGHTFEVVVDPGNEDWEKSFEIDGDGAFKIDDVEYEKDDDDDYDDYDEIEIKEESLKNIQYFKKENELTDEMINSLKEFYDSEDNVYFKDLDFIDWLYAIKDYEGGTIYSEILEDYMDDVLGESKEVKKESFETFTMPENVIDVLQVMQKCMNYLSRIWNNNEEYLNNGDYPFDKSFNEITTDFDIWVRQCKSIYFNGSEN